jgi:hypothetical protein
MRQVLLGAIALFLIADVAHAQDSAKTWTSRSLLSTAPPPAASSNPYGNSVNSPNLYYGQGQDRGSTIAKPYNPNTINNPIYNPYGGR